jgi:hypothetical protein
MAQMSNALANVYSFGNKLRNNLKALLTDPVNHLASQANIWAADMNRALDSPATAYRRAGGVMADDPSTVAAANREQERMTAALMGTAPGFVGMTRQFVAPRDEAMRIAQQNAARPVSKGGLGLRPDNTPMERARAMGFYDGWKHGSPNPNITAFDPTFAEKRGVDFGDATFATKSGDNASGYSLNWKEFANHPAKQANEAKRQMILDRFLAAKNAGKDEEALLIRRELDQLHGGDALYEDFLNYKLPSSGSTVYPLMIRADDMPWIDGGRKNFSQVHEMAIGEARNAGAPGVRINDVADNSGRFNGTSDVMAVFDPSRIRSRFAAFDPARVNENDMLGFVNPRLLAALGLGGAAAVAGNSLLNSGKKKMEDAKKARQQAIEKAEEK